jgi:hypothetical protein
MDEAAILDRIDELTDDEKVVAELKRELGKDHDIKAMLSIYEPDELALINPIGTYNALEKNESLSPKAKEFRDLCFQLADVAHAEAAKKRLELGLEGGED